MALHTGECEFVDDLRGSAVTIAATAANHARHGEVLMTQTTKGLVPGSGFKFGHWGSRVLKESEGGRLFTVER
jgi:class 3 adenylate cyclase